MLLTTRERLGLDFQACRDIRSKNDLQSVFVSAKAKRNKKKNKIKIKIDLSAYQIQNVGFDFDCFIKTAPSDVLIMAHRFYGAN